MGHQFVIKFVGSDIVQNKESFEAGVLFSSQHSWTAGTEKLLLKLLSSEPGFSIWLDYVPSITSSLPFGSYYDKQARALPSSLLLHHHPTNGSDRLRGREYPVQRLRLIFRSILSSIMHSHCEAAWLDQEISIVTEVSTIIFRRSWEKWCISQLLDCYAFINSIINLKGMCFSQYDLLVAVIVAIIMV